jgi:hypothetical protein
MDPAPFEDGVDADGRTVVDSSVPQPVDSARARPIESQGCRRAMGLSRIEATCRSGF